MTSEIRKVSGYAFQQDLFQHQLATVADALGFNLAQQGPMHLNSVLHSLNSLTCFHVPRHNVPNRCLYIEPDSWSNRLYIGANTTDR